jgi:hypothetical protein
MTEVAMVKILPSMECLRLLCGKLHMNVQGWEDLRSEFKVTAMEWGMSKIKSTSTTWYLRIEAVQHVEARHKTPKWHVLLNHAANQLADMDRLGDMGKDCIEQNHQSRKKDRH